MLYYAYRVPNIHRQYMAGYFLCLFDICLNFPFNRKLGPAMINTTKRTQNFDHSNCCHVYMYVCTTIYYVHHVQIIITYYRDGGRTYLQKGYTLFIGIACAVISVAGEVVVVVEVELDDDVEVRTVTDRDGFGVIICDCNCRKPQWEKPSPWLYCKRDILHSDLGSLIVSKRRFPKLMAVTSETKKDSSLQYLSAMYLLFSSAHPQ